MPPKTPSVAKNFRLSPETLRQLRNLAERWGETETGVITRAIGLAHYAESNREFIRLAEMNNNRVYHGPVQIEEQED